MSVFRVERAERKAVIPGYGKRYEVSDLGKVYSGGCEMSVIDGKWINLSYNGDVKRFSVAYLVARAFLRNTELRPYVVHVDGDLRNNRVENLMWSESRDRGKAGRPAETRRTVLVYSVRGEFVGEFQSVRAASAALGVARSLIRNCAVGKARRAKQYIFRYRCA